LFICGLLVLIFVMAGLAFALVEMTMKR